MAVLAAILPVVSSSSCLALKLYQFAASSPKETKDLIKVAKAINNFASILKQVGMIIKEDDRLPSFEALDVLEDVTVQSQTALKNIEDETELRRNERYGEGDGVRPSKDQSRNRPLDAKLSYFATHLECLRLTLAVLLQTLYTAQSIMWSKLRPTVSPKQAAKAVANEKIQLQTLIVEQQMSILSAQMLYYQVPSQDRRLLMESDSSQSLVATGRESSLPGPNHLYQYQDEHLGSLETSGFAEDAWLPTVCTIAGPRTEQLLERWTSLPNFEQRLLDAERMARTQKHENKQATVESDSGEENVRQKYGPDGAGLTSSPPQRAGSVQTLFADTTTLPIPVPGTKFGPTAPMSPAASPRTSRATFEIPTSPRTSVGSLPVEAAAAAIAKEGDDDLDLEIPWTLRTRKYEWRYVDGKVVGSNTDLLPSTAHTERPAQNWTEVMASWVCKEAIQEAGYKVKQVQKERKDGRRTKFDTCFCIEQPLKFSQIKRLVERTVDIYRKNVTPTPPQPAPPRSRRTSFDRPSPGPCPSYLAKTAAAQHRDRTPTASRPQPLLERSSSIMTYPPPPPPLDRSMSMPGPGMVHPPPYPPSINSQTSSRPMAMAIPGPLLTQNAMSNSHFSSSLPPQGLYRPQMQQPSNSPQHYSLPPPVGPLGGPQYNNNPLPPHMQPFTYPQGPQSPTRQSHPMSRAMDRYDDDSMTSDSGSGERRRRRSKSRRRYDRDADKKKHSKSAAMGTLMGISGLTALLDVWAVI
ncbi:uncharacterized protein M421DRAFT_4158 [Didymella exigua CBS 183.55]|uniref:Fungal N-terminal domain-containing protein n=1 Tax=Didymella exigua CBS 183.55 TaxID=1150837 RepID=A0A6A5RPW5_9PLEO|nr:uncharacterized protein M421DRAFT_4158 [Didymella exigua CBS 183.55]KAF1929709.1 hypothetical protein M421DRAFT_4158 [Didymella exigua CBS 183.55]